MVSLFWFISCCKSVPHLNISQERVGRAAGTNLLLPYKLFTIAFQEFNFGQLCKFLRPTIFDNNIYITPSCFCWGLVSGMLWLWFWAKLSVLFELCLKLRLNVGYTCTYYCMLKYTVCWHFLLYFDLNQHFHYNWTEIFAIHSICYNVIY